MAFLLLLGLLLLWRWPGERAGETGAAPGPSASPSAAEAPPTALAPPARQAHEPAPLGTGELAPFSSARANSAQYAGKTGSLRGRVEVSGEEPFPRAWRLRLRPSLTLPEREHARERTLEFEDGGQDFVVRELPLGGYDVCAEAEGFNGQVLPVLLAPGAEHPFVNLRLVPAGRLEGVVRDAAGLAAEGVTLTLFAVSDGSAREARTDANGHYVFERVTDGPYELLVGAATAPLVPERRPLTFLAPHLSFPDIELPPLGAIHVRVVDSLARPLEGVQVRGSGTNGGLVEGTTDWNGELLARHLPAGHFRLRLAHPALEEKYARRVAVDVVAGAVAEAPVGLGP